MWDLILDAAPIAVSLLALAVAIKASKQDRATADDTRKLAAQANDVQARLLAIEEARRFEEMAPSFGLAYDHELDPKRPGYARLLITYNGRVPCERTVLEEVRGPRWSTGVLAIERHTPHAKNGHTWDVLEHLEPGETRPFVVTEEPRGNPGEIRLRFTATVNGHEYQPMVESCYVEPRSPPRVRFT